MKKKLRHARKKLGVLFDGWLKRTGLRWWRDIKINYLKKTPKSFKRKNSTVAARTWASWQYMEARIDIALPIVARMSEQELEDLVVHEIVHILINEMREEGIKHEERVVTRLSQALMWTREGQ